MVQMVVVNGVRYRPEHAPKAPARTLPEPEPEAEKAVTPANKMVKPANKTAE